MFKCIHRCFIILPIKTCSSVKNTTRFVNSNVFMSALATSQILLNSFTRDIAKRSYSESVESSDSDSEEFLNKIINPSVEIQKKIQEAAQEKLDDLLAANPEMDKLYKIIELEIDVLRQSSMKVPEIIKATDWLRLIQMKTLTSRRKFLEFMWLNEIKKKNSKIRKREIVAIKKAIDEKETNELDYLEYGLRNNTMFTRIYKSTMSQVMNQKLITAMMFGEKLVIDLGFESQMSFKEISSCAKQLMFAFVANRISKDPFDIYMCNLDPKGELKKRLISFFPTMEEPGYPLNTTSQSYLELFPKEKLVYLTPNTTNVMQKYNPDDIYIIGGIVDKSDCKPVTMAKAKEEGLRVAKFPLDNYLDWKPGSGKSLNLNHCVEILVDVKNTNNWEYALRAVPTRKIVKQFIDYDITPRIAKTFKNYHPKFQSAQASHVPDLAYYNKMKGNK